ncbi:MAG: glycosyltransferase involved in cell wall biosynthesis [Planctomycetota bacterium]|jgi:glycosyltransferase involved in cell wall biosynthesis
MISPRVSICMITYNHEGWIRQAIESVLCQDLGDLEIVVGDDASTDDTLAIVNDLAAQDARVRPLPTAQNLGGKKNFARTFDACRGEFLCALDGDDFFTNPAKLSTQVRMLEEHPEFSGCFSKAHHVGPDGVSLGERNHPYPHKASYTKEDFARYCLCDSSSMMSRRGLFGKLPPLFYDAPQGDWPLHMLNALHGDIGYVPEPMSAYRVHPGGVWSKRSETAKIATNLECQRQFLIHLPQDVVRAIHPSIARSVWGQVTLAMRDHQLEQLNVLLNWMDENCAGMVKAKTKAKVRQFLQVARWEGH